MVAGKDGFVQKIGSPKFSDSSGGSHYFLKKPMFNIAQYIKHMFSMCKSHVCS